MSEQLAVLAAAYGVATTYEDWRGESGAVSQDTLVAVLGALGVDATTPEAVARALDEARLAPWRRQLPPVTVARRGEPATVPVRGPAGEPVESWAELEDGGVRRDLRRIAVDVRPVEVDGVAVGETHVQIPGDVPLGWHRLHARCGDREASAPLVVTPGYLGLPAQLGGEAASGGSGGPAPMNRGRVWGPMVQLYSLRSRASWGIGELPDLAELASLSGRALGAGLVLTNPLHAAEPVTPIDPSPYFPASRRFADPLYLRVTDVPECARLDESGRERVRQLAAPLLDRNHTAELLDRDAVWEAKRDALELVFAAGRDEQRQQRYAAFRAREGEALVHFATWCALAERRGLPWQAWPGELHDPRSDAVARARDELAGRVDFFCWLQWLLDEQLDSAQAAAREAGMTLGVIHDLAVGVSPGGADAWMLGETLARGVTGGAPPDAFNQQGQDWGQPPWRPDRLAEAGYAPYRDMLRFALRHGGGLRIDHILGLFRLWWIPDGAPASAGTYVRYDHEALVGILALEAYRAGALVIGEDLGTVEPWVRDYLAERGILGTSMLWFENDDQGRPLPPEQWRELCLATVATHDMPPIAGYLAGEHIELRERLGLLSRPVAEERADSQASFRAWSGALRNLGLLGSGPSDGSDAGDDGDGGGDVVEEGVPGDATRQWAIVRALHAFLTRTPARLLGVALTDAVGERRTQNQPGTTSEYPNWRVPLTDGDGRPVLLEDLRGDSAAARGLFDLARTVTPAIRDSSHREGTPSD